MRELNKYEVQSVHGGFGVVGAAIGAAIGISGAWARGCGATGIASAGILGALSGMAGGFAASAVTGGFFLRAGWAVRSVGLGFATGEVGADDSE